MRIDYDKDLNPAQREAALSDAPALLVIAGAGSGKTRAVVYRLARLVQGGVSPDSILLLTFTRKASQEMLLRAGRLLGVSDYAHGDFPAARGLLGGVQGGTFHSFAYRALRRTPPSGYEQNFTVMDRADADDAMRSLKSELGLGKGDRAFPKIATVVELLSKARNKESDISEIMARDAFHLAGYAEDVGKLGAAFSTFKKRYGVLDYDDLLFSFEALLLERPELREIYRRRFKHVMVDEYQDTNLVQARLVKLLEPEQGSIMVVGDDAQSIYAFRGANVKNILEFPSVFPGAQVVKLEQNYRSVQPILDLTNRILAASRHQYKKELFSEIPNGKPPQLIRPISDLTQAKVVVDKIVALLSKYPAQEIAVLFRAGYQSYHIETNLAKIGLPFKKYGGQRFSEAAHIKDMLAYLRLVRNPSDLPAWRRAAGHVKGVGEKTSAKLHDAHMTGDQAGLQKLLKKWPALASLLDMLHALRSQPLTPAGQLERILEFYTPILIEQHPDDYPRRQKGVEELILIAAGYTDLDQFLADMSLESPEARKDEERPCVTLSTIHQAKGLEWSAVLVIDLVNERFPSRHALNNAEDFEEERRLLYVACTRAREYLALCAPKSLYKRGQDGSEPAEISPFLREISTNSFEQWDEHYTGGLTRKDDYSQPRPLPTQSRPAPSILASSPIFESPSAPAPAPGKLGYCKHKIFGRGKLVEAIPPDKHRVNFPGFGLKVILTEYLELES